ncbi:MAG TPA: PHP domain-containing protein, partial [Rhodoferax sp.]|nr:PHP domain-containing protein [Rhodoferax sp.]
MAALPHLSRQPQLPAYAELRCLSNFSFLKGASQPEELVTRAQALGYAALAITDECSMAGVVRAHVAAKACGLKLLVGSQFQVSCATPFHLVVLACNLNGYGNLCEFITRLRCSAEKKGSYHLRLEDTQGAGLADCLMLVCPERSNTPAQLLVIGQWLLRHFTGRCWLGVTQLLTLDDEIWLHNLRQLSDATAIALVAVGDVHMHLRSRKPLQ